MKQLFFISLFCVALFTGNSNAREISFNKLTNSEHLISNLDNYGSFTILVDQFIIDDQETSEINGFSFFVDKPEIQSLRLNNKECPIHLEILFAPKFEVITLISDLPPPSFS